MVLVSGGKYSIRAFTPFLDDALNPLGLATKKIYIRTVDSVAEYLAPRGFTLEMALKYREELENEKDNSVNIYCCWALFQ
jgi:hypothetical protein